MRYHCTPSHITECALETETKYALKINSRNLCLSYCAFSNLRETNRNIMCFQIFKDLPLLSVTMRVASHVLITFSYIFLPIHKHWLNPPPLPVIRIFEADKNINRKGFFWSFPFTSQHFFPLSISDTMLK